LDGRSRQPWSPGASPTGGISGLTTSPTGPLPSASDRSLALATRTRRQRRGRPFDTVTVTGTLVPTLLATSKAWAVRVCDPLVAVAVSQMIEYGGVVSGPPRATPSSLNWTVVTPTLSEAVADTITAEPDTVAPSPGAVRTIVGAEVSDPAGGTPEIAPAVDASSAVIFAPTSLPS